MTANQQKKSNAAKQVLGIVLAVVCLIIAFQGTDVRLLWRYIQEIQPVFLVLVCVSALLSHLIRAWRWTILLSPLSEKKIGLFNSFSAVMLGYAVNVVIPRGGEVARLVSITKTENLPWAGVLSTMFIDRLLDIAMLVFLLGATLTVLPPELTRTMPWLVPGGISLTVSTVIGLLLLPQMGFIIQSVIGFEPIRSRIPASVMQTISKLAEQFDVGTRSLKNPIAYPTIALLSVGIWFFYWLNFYLMIFGFRMESHVSALKCLTVFTIGSVGVLVPTPGSIGSFHFLVSQALMLVAGIGKDQALAYVTVLHIVCFVLITFIPAYICTAIQNSRALPPPDVAAAVEEPKIAKVD